MRFLSSKDLLRKRFKAAGSMVSPYLSVLFRGFTIVCGVRGQGSGTLYRMSSYFYTPQCKPNLSILYSLETKRLYPMAGRWFDP